MVLRMKKGSEVKNTDSPFTEIFTLLKRYEALSDGLTALVYNSDELILLHKHIENVVEVLLQGLKSLGQVVGDAAHSTVISINDVSQIGFLISAISNLTESLSILKSDANYSLRLRGLVSF